MAYATITDIEGELLLSAGSINSTSLPSTNQVYSWIAQAEDRIDTKTGNQYKQTLETNKIYDWEGNDDLLRIDPFVSITTLEYNVATIDTTPSWVTKTENTDFYTYPEEGEVRFATTNFNPASGHRKFRLTYLKGQSQTPPIVKEIAAKIVANRVVSATVNNQATEQSGGSVQVGTIKIEDPTAFSVSAFKQRDSEIKAFFNEDMGVFKTYRIARAYDL